MTTLRILEIFDSLQGEGYWTGVPMTFVRLSGCNGPDLGLGCVAWCDTPDGWDRCAGEELETAEIVRRIHLPRMCLTGGEPLLQVEGGRALVAEAHRWGIRVHVETNGTVDPGVSYTATEGPGEVVRPALEPGSAFDWVVVSPKPPDYFVAPGWGGSVDELKLVVDDRLDAATAERLAAAHPGAVVFLQPEWGPGAAPGVAGVDGVDGVDGAVAAAGRAGAGHYEESCERAVALVMDHPEWRLSLQTHKLLGIR